MLSIKQKLEILESANSKIDLIKVLIRLSKDNNCINKESYLNLQENLHEIGKMAGGWIRYLKMPERLSQDAEPNFGLALSTLL